MTIVPVPAAQVGHVDASHAQALVRTRSGHMVDTSEIKWRISPDQILNWEKLLRLPAFVLAPLQAYLRHLIRYHAADYASSQLTFLSTIWSNEHVIAGLESHSEEGLGLSLFNTAKRSINKTVAAAYVRNYLDAYRRWYLWSTDAGFDGFDEDVAASLEEIVIGRNPTGAAVLNHDPDCGPLRDDEMASLVSKLRAATTSRRLSLVSLSAAWLFVAFGMNVRNIWLLNDEDLKRIADQCRA